MDDRQPPPVSDEPIVIGPERIEPQTPVTADPSPPPDEVIVAPAAIEGPGATAEAIVVEAPADEPPRRPVTQAHLRRERKELWDEREETIYHIGGLATDLRRRGIEDVELVNRRADLVLDIDRRIADIDANLVEMDTRRRTTAPPVAGYCLSCGAPYQTEAAFCFRCGSRVLPPDPVEPPMADTPTTVIDMSQDPR